MKEKISFVGLGQCGSNIVALAERKGYVSGIINTSPEDLESPSMKFITNKLLLGKDGGAGKDRKLAKDNVKKYYKDIVNFFKQNIINNKTKIVYICFSASGGTGSGFGPIMIDLLKKFFPYVTFSAIIVTPSEDESSIALYNSRKCLEEIYNLEIPVMLPDNQTYNNNRSRKQIYDLVNNEIIDNLTSFIEEREASSISNIDEQDKLKLLTTSGVLLITTAILPDYKQLSSYTKNTDISSIIQNSWDNSVFVNLDYDKVISRVGYIFEAPEKISSLIDYNMIHKNLGTPLEIFEGIYENKEQPKIISILTGLSFPENKINKIDNLLSEIEENKNNIHDNLKKSSLAISQKSSLFDVEDDNIENNNTNNDTISMNLESLFDNY